MTRSIQIAAASILLASCAVQQQPEVVNIGHVVTRACADSVPARPVFSADTLTGDEDIFQKVKTLDADGLETRAHIGTLETTLLACIRRVPAASAP